MEGIQVIELPIRHDARGNLSFLEPEKHVPFRFEELRWIYNISNRDEGKGMKSSASDEFVVPLSGSLEIVTGHSENVKTVSLNRAHLGLLIPAHTPFMMQNFATNTCLLVISSESRRITA